MRLSDGRPPVKPGYARAMPRDWFVENARELVWASILDDFARFWSRDA